MCGVKTKNSNSLLFSVACELYSKEWANRKLKFVHLVLYGKVCKSSDVGKLQLALLMKEDLLEHGFPWQAARVENFIHRWKGLLSRDRRAAVEARALAASVEADLSEREREGASL